MRKEDFKNLEIGKEFMLGNKKIKVEQEEAKYSCEKCFFYKNDLFYKCTEMIEENIIPECFGHQRKDGKDVIFKEVK